MNPRKLKIAAAAIVATAAAYTGAAWWAGKAAETTLAKQHQLLADLPYFVVKSRQYERGLFTSHERATIALSPNIALPYKLLKLDDLTESKLELTYTQTIHHGPLPLLWRGNPMPMKAAVITSIEFSAETQKWLTKVFGDQKPIEIENRISFNDDGVLTLKMPNASYEETLAKVKATFQGLDAKIAYGGDFNSVDITASAPGLRFEAGPKGVFDLKNLRFTAHNARGSAGLMLGDGKLSLDMASFQQHEEGKQPLDLKLENLDYAVNTSAKGDFIDSSADLGLKTLVLNGKPYGPAKLSVAANHLHGPTLAKLSKSINTLQRTVPDPADQATRMLEVLRKEGLPLLKNDPALAIKTLSIQLPEGEVSLKADLALKGFQDADLENPIKLLERLQAHADLKLPKQVIETYVLWQARGMIATDTAEGEHPDTADLDNLARNLMENQIRKLTEQNLIRAEGSMLATTADWKDGKLTVNGKAVPLPWQLPPPAAE